MTTSEHIIVIVFGIMALLSVCIYIWCKLYEIWLRHPRYKDTNSHFTSDIFHLQMKWAKKGETEYAQALGKVIDHFNAPSLGEAQTQQGEYVLENLKKAYGA